jgi:glycosyltransferase involved in cell wall biosynthesis
MKIRILYLTAETFPTFRVDVSVLFGKFLPQYGIQTDIVAGKTPGSEEADSWGGGETYLCDVSGGSAKKRINTFLHSIKCLFKTNAKQYQAIQVRDMPLLATIGLLVSRFKGLKFFYWMSYPIPDGQIILARNRGLSAGIMKFLFPWVSGRLGCFLLYRIVLPKADHTFVQSDRMKEDLVQRGIDPARMTPVPMGVDIEALQNLNLTPVNDERLVGKRVLVYLGTFEHTRRIDILFEMLAIIKRQIPNVLLVLVGDTNDEVQRKWLKMKADEAGINDHLIWTGWLPMYQAWSYVQSAEIGLSPFPRSYLLDSASPTKVPEYLALGVPVVCNDNPDQEHIISETGAGICITYTAEEFASAVIKLLNVDKNKRHDMVMKGRDYMSRYRNYRIIGRTVADCYKNMLLEGPLLK